jgi:gas vesicle protein
MRGFSKKHLAGFLFVGAAAGAVIGLLYAPKSGAQTRKELRRFSKRTANRIDNLQSDVIDQLNAGYDQVTEAFDNVKEYLEDGRKRLKRMVQSA